ncbi:hypothetical protein A3738_14475 [Oleiphilus sp. HI0066]|nr:hypothetical protein A3738_14475 [Oleiphilus sp. HI0066]
MQAHSSINKEKYPENYAKLLIAIDQFEKSDLPEHQSQVKQFNLVVNEKRKQRERLPVSWYAIIAIVFLWLALDAHIDGYHGLKRGGEITREDDPFWFYLFVGMYLVGAAHSLLQMFDAFDQRHEKKKTSNIDDSPSVDPQGSVGNDEKAPRGFFDSLLLGPVDIPTAEKIIKISICVSVLIALLTASLAVMELYQKSSNLNLIFALKHFILIDAFLLLVLTFFLYKRQLWAAICLVVYLVLNEVIKYIDLDKIPSLFTVLKILLFIGAARSVYFIGKHRGEPKDGSSQQNKSDADLI